MIKEPLLKQFENSEISPSVVRAKDGAEAAIKAENQKFDLILIDTEVPRLMDGGFLFGIQSYKNTQEADLFVVSEKGVQELPETLKTSKFFQKPVSPSELINSMIEVINTQYLSNKEAVSAAAGAANSKYAVDVRVINAVIKSTTKVLKQFGISTIVMEKAGPKSAAEPLMGEVSSIVDIQSQSFQGYLCISFEKGSYLEVISTILMQEQTELTKSNQDAVGEINNIIFGNAKSEISHQGVKMTIPRVLLGKNQSVPCPPGSAGMIIPFKTVKGSFYITVYAFPLAVQT